MFATRIRCANCFAIAEVVLAIDAVDEDHARLGVIIGRAHDAVPERAGRERLIDLSRELQRPVAICSHRIHEGVAREHGEIEHRELAGRTLGVDEEFDVGMIAGERRHHRAAPRAGRHDGAAHRIPHAHE